MKLIKDGEYWELQNITVGEVDYLTEDPYFAIFDRLELEQLKMLIEDELNKELSNKIKEL